MSTHPKVRHFPSGAAFRHWLERHHARAGELWVGFYKKDSGRTGITYAEAVDEALCFGWIDGIKKRVDPLSYTNRFTPRKPGSNWSRINTLRAEELKKLGRMAPAGLKAFESRDRARQAAYSFEQDNPTLDSTAEKRFRANRTAWAFFQKQPPGYRRKVLWWVVSAKRDGTRARRLGILMANSEQGRRLDPMNPNQMPVSPAPASR